MTDRPGEEREDFTESSEGELSDEYKARILRRIAEELEARASGELQPERMSMQYFVSYDKL